MEFCRLYKTRHCEERSDVAILNTVTNGEVLHLYHEQQNRFNHFCGGTSRYNCHKLVYYEEYSMNPERVDLLPEIATSLRSSQ